MAIDFVVPWVDGNDPDWLLQKAQYSPNDAGNNLINRYRDWGLMKYWFRAIEAFTPWVRTVHFITWGHVPEFLNVDNPKLHIVHHEEYMPKEALPTFSSHALELNIHRIEGLSEKFVYLNDDTFIIRPMAEEDFFKDELPCTFGAEAPFELIGEIGIWQHAAINDLGIINRHFKKRNQVANYRNKYISKKYPAKTNLRTIALEMLCPNTFTGFYNLHAPAAYRKETFEEVWRAEPEILLRTTKHRFRATNDLNQWVMLWWQVASGKFSPARVDNVTYLANKRNLEIITKLIKGQERAMVCINDPDEPIDFDYISESIRDAFEFILPEKSSFEK